MLGGGPLRVELRWAGADRRMALVALEGADGLNEAVGADNHMNSLASQTIALDDFVLPDE